MVAQHKFVILYTKLKSMGEMLCPIHE